MRCLRYCGGECRLLICSKVTESHHRSGKRVKRVHDVMG